MSTLPKFPSEGNSFSMGANRLSKAQRLIDSLRELATFYEEHPDFPMPSLDTVNTFVHSKKELADAARALAPCSKDVTGETEHDWYLLVREFGAIRLEVNIRRGQLCERVVVGKRIVPAHVIPAKAEELIPEREEEINEWRCPELLAEDGAE